MGIEKKKSFTLIELIIAVGVIGLVLPSIFSIFFTMMRQQLVLVAYQEMKQQGDSAQRNMVNLLQNRAAYVTDDTYTVTDICPVFPLPTPTEFPRIYMKDKDSTSMSIYSLLVSEINTIASSSGNRLLPYNLTTNSVAVSGLAFSCRRINEFTPAIVTVRYTINKGTAFKEMSLPYAFTVRLRNY